MSEKISPEEESSTEYWLTRHSKSGKGIESSPGLSEQGVELAKERAKTISELIKTSKNGTVIFYGGVTSTDRTRSTMELYTDEVEKILKESGERVHFIKKEDIKEEADQSGYLKTAKAIASKVNNAPDDKVVIELPLFLKEFSMEEYFFEEDGKTAKPQWQALLDKHGKNYSAAIKEWFGDSEANSVVDPEEMAKKYLSGIQRLADFSRRFFPDRPLKIGLVGHSFMIDALLTYIANGKIVSPGGFDKIGGDVVQETELSTIEFDGNNNLVLNYRGKKFSQELSDERK